MRIQLARISAKNRTEIKKVEDILSNNWKIIHISDIVDGSEIITIYHLQKEFLK